MSRQAGSRREVELAEFTIPRRSLVLAKIRVFAPKYTAPFCLLFSFSLRGAEIGSEAVSSLLLLPDPQVLLLAVNLLLQVR